MVQPEVSEDRSSQKKTWPLALGVGAVLLVVGIAGAWTLRSMTDDDDAESASEGEIFVQEEGEIFLEPADEVGPEPFAETAFASAPLPEHTEQATPVGDQSNVVATSDGRTPGLYGGSSDDTVCEPAEMIEFLTKNPAKAEAFVTALNTDPDVTALNGGLLTVADIPTYIGGLTPVILNADTRVTNNGFRDGKPTPRQAVLQKGSAVLVDANGIPRARCYCGNPLTAPVPSSVAPTYTGGTANWTTPTNLQVTSPPATPSTAPLQVSPPGNPTGPLTPLSPPVYTTCPFTDPALCAAFMSIYGVPTTTQPPGASSTTSSSTTTSAPTSTTTTTTSTTTTQPGANKPVLANVGISRDAGNDSFCVATYGPTSQGYDVTGSYSDQDGDFGNILTIDFGAGAGHEDASSYTTFTGDGSSGTFTSGICTDPGTSIGLILGDQQGNGSNESRIAAP